jgi:hypothetical protein
MSDIAKVRRGDLVAVISQARSAYGLFAVLGVGKAWFEAVPADMQSSMQRNKLMLSDVAIHIAGGAGPALPAASGLDLDTPPPQTQTVAAPTPETQPEPLVVISVPDPNRKGYSFPIRGVTDPVVIVPEDSPHLNHNQLSKKVIRVPASLVGIVLGGIDGSHLVGERPDPPVDAFGEED